MLDVVEVRTPLGALLSLPLEDPTGGYYVDSIEGLDPVKASLTSVNYAQADGAQFRSARRDPRNIVFEITLEPDYTVESVQALRERLYAYFMPKSVVNLRFKISQFPSTAQTSRDIQGRVEDLTMELFAEKPTAHISIICFDPNFVDPSTLSMTGNVVVPSEQTQKTIDYRGTVATGYKVTITLTELAYTFTLYHRSPAGVIQTMEITYTFQAGDILTVSTLFGAKTVTVTRNGVTTNILGALRPTSTWPQLETGLNALRITASPFSQPYVVEYQPRYGGL